MKKGSRRPEHYYTPEIARSICERVLEGEPLRQICKDPNMPARSTIFLWLEAHKVVAR